MVDRRESPRPLPQLRPARCCQLVRRAGAPPRGEQPHSLPRSLDAGRDPRAGRKPSQARDRVGSRLLDRTPGSRPARRLSRSHSDRRRPHRYRAGKGARARPERSSCTGRRVRPAARRAQRGRRRQREHARACPGRSQCTRRDSTCPSAGGAGRARRAQWSPNVRLLRPLPRTRATLRSRRARPKGVRRRRRYDRLEGDALAERVAHDIATTRGSRVARGLWRVEQRLALRLPFGIRNLVVLRRGLQ